MFLFLEAATCLIGMYSNITKYTERVANPALANQTQVIILYSTSQSVCDNMTYSSKYGN
jgi:hypothetical protein